MHFLKANLNNKYRILKIYRETTKDIENKSITLHHI